MAKEERQRINNLKNYIMDKIESDKRHDEVWERVASLPKPSTKEDALACGEDWFNIGKTLEEAPDNLRNHHFFKVGYDIGKRKAYAKSLEDTVNKGKSR